MFLSKMHFRLGVPLFAALLFVSCGAWRNDDRGVDRAAVCGDFACTGNETCSTCSKDCGTCSGVTVRCGDGRCVAPETCTACPADCSPCPPAGACGDGSCGQGEDCKTCASDCGACPAACPLQGEFSVAELAVRDNASGQYILGIKGFSPHWPVTVSGIRLADGSVANDLLIAKAPVTAPADAAPPFNFNTFIFLPGKPDCVKTSNDVLTGSNNCRCDFPLIVGNGQQQCVYSPIVTCAFCGALSPTEHEERHIDCGGVVAP